MAETPDESQKTEEPTEKKLRDAIQKGNVAKSTEISNWFILVGGALIVVFYAGPMAQVLVESLSQFLARPHELAERLETPPELARDIVLLFVRVIWLPMGILLIAAVLGNVLQHAPVFSTEKMKPKLDKISPIKGLKRLFGMSSLVNFSKSLAKLVIVGFICFVVIWPERDVLPSLIARDVASYLPLLRELTLKLLAGVISVLTVLALLDFIYQKFEHRKKLRMTKQEVKDEHKQMEGDPTVKAKLRQLRMERGRKRMMQAVPSATVVVTNPTHYAVALKYEHGQTQAPVVVAKGVDQIALKIRALANENDVPIIENPPLARLLYAQVELDQEIAADHYQAVAEVISFVMKLKTR